MAFAEEFPYFDTTVSPAKSQGDVVELLEAFGADAVMVAQGTAGGKYAWLVRFQWQGRNYRFEFTPLQCRNPLKDRSFGGKRRSFAEQARWQMGRIAVHFTKAILTAAEAHPGALFGFLEITAGSSAPGGLPPIASQLDVSALANTTPLLPDPSNDIEGDYEIRE
jgi:hypothetical protein